MKNGTVSISLSLEKGLTFEHSLKWNSTYVIIQLKDYFCGSHISDYNLVICQNQPNSVGKVHLKDKVGN